MKALVIIILVLCACCAQGRDYQQALRVLSTIESSGMTNAVGDHGRAVGQFQIWDVQRREVNRLLGYRRYTTADRRDPAKAAEMVLVFLAWEDGRHPRDTTERWLARWRNPTGPVPGWYMKKIHKALITKSGA